MSGSDVVNTNAQQRIAARQAEFDEFMNHFSSAEMFGEELFQLYSLDASPEATRLLADCIEAHWIVMGDGASGEAAVASRESLESIREKMSQNVE